MAITIPDVFASHIQGSNTNIFPYVIIDVDGLSIRISTNAFSISFNDGTIETYKPLLLNVPSLKESIDLETRKYKINSVSLDISNVKYEGTRFSDSVSSKSLINSRVQIYWGSPVLDSNNDALLVYDGTVRRYTHTDDKAKIDLEDRSQAYLHKDLPLPENYLGTSRNVPDKYKNKPIPMVYGHVDKSPCVIELKGTQTIIAENNNIGYANTTSIWGVESPLYIFMNENYVNIFNDQIGNYIDNNGNIITSRGLAINKTALTQANQLACRSIYNPKSITLINGQYNTIISDDEISLFTDEDLNTFIEKQTTGQIDTLPNIDNYMLVFIWGTDNDIDIEDKEIAFNNYGFQTHEDTVDQNTGEILKEEIEYPIVKRFYSSVNNIILPSNNNPEPTSVHYYHITQPSSLAIISDLNQSFTITGDDGIERDLSSLLGLGFDAVANETSDITAYCEENYLGESTSRFIIDSGLKGYQNAHSISIVGHGEAGLAYLSKLKIKNINVMSEFIINNFLDKKYYVNAIGRLSTGVENSPTAPSAIADILEKELGVDANSLDQAPNFSVDMNYAFTIDKKINSKKLIEELASASPFIPHFNNQGNFKFDVIPATNPTVDHTIQESKVIDFTFKRTKVENVKTKVEVKYKWDYARKEFGESVVASLGDGSADLDDDATASDYSAVFNYYKLESDHSQSTLVVDDHRGKYIRDSATAKNLANFLLDYHMNQHLILSVKLPLSVGLVMEVGDIVEFDSLLGGIKPYGIDYRPNVTSILNNQNLFQKFIITNTNKTLEMVTIECEQLHKLMQVDHLYDEEGTYDLANADTSYQQQIYGCTHELATNVNPDATVDDGSCTFDPTNPALNFCHTGQSQWMPVYDQHTPPNIVNNIIVYPEETSDPITYDFQDGNGETTISNNADCEYTAPEMVISGCTIPQAGNYHELAQEDDGSCVNIQGCTIYGATNCLDMTYGTTTNQAYGYQIYNAYQSQYSVCEFANDQVNKHILYPNQVNLVVLHQKIQDLFSLEYLQFETAGYFNRSDLIRLLIPNCLAIQSFRRSYPTWIVRSIRYYRDNLNTDFFGTQYASDEYSFPNGEEWNTYSELRLSDFNGINANAYYKVAKNQDVFFAIEVESEITLPMFRKLEYEQSNTMPDFWTP